MTSLTDVGEAYVNSNSDPGYLTIAEHNAWERERWTWYIPFNEENLAAWERIREAWKSHQNPNWNSMDVTSGQKLEFGYKVKLPKYCGGRYMQASWLVTEPLGFPEGDLGDAFWKGKYLKTISEPVGE